MTADPKHDARFYKQKSFLGGVVVLALLAVILWRSVVEKHLEWPDVLFALTANLIAASVAFLWVSAFLQEAKDKSRANQLQNEVVDPLKAVLRDLPSVIIPRINDVKWGIYFKDTTEIVLLVQGWDGWAETVEDFLPDFLHRGGRIRLILHDPTEQTLLARMHERMPHKDPKVEIEQTVSKLRAVVERNIAPELISERFQTHYTKRMNWFCGIYFRPDTLLLSLYQHKHFNEIYHTKSPSFLIRTDVFPNIGEWFDKECDHLVTPESEPQR